MASNTELRQQATARMLQDAILQLCVERVQYTHKLHVLGVVCVTADDDDPQEVVIKMNETHFRRLPATSSPIKPPTAAAASAAAAATSTVTTSMNRHQNQGYSQQPISMQQQLAQYQSFLQHMTFMNKASYGMSSHQPGHSAAAAMQASNIMTSPHAATLSSSLLLSPSDGATSTAGSRSRDSMSVLCDSFNNNVHTARTGDRDEPKDDEEAAEQQPDVPLSDSKRVSTPVSRSDPATPVPDATASPITSPIGAALTSPGASKRSLGRKARKPTRIERVYDEGDSIMDDDDSSDDDDEMILLTEFADGKDADGMDNESGASTPAEIRQQVLETHDDASNQSEDEQVLDVDTSPIKAGSAFGMTQSMTSRSPASIRALVHEQAQRRQQEKLEQHSRSGVDNNNDNEDGSILARSEADSPYTTADGVTPILVTPLSPDDAMQTSITSHVVNGYAGDVDELADEQVEALDFSTDKDNISKRSAKRASDVTNSDGCKAKIELTSVKDEDAANKSLTSPASDGAHHQSFSPSPIFKAENFLKSMPGMNHSAFPSPFPTFAFPNGMNLMSAMNLSTCMAPRYSLPAAAARGSTSNSGGGIGIKYTANGPIAVGADGQNLSRPNRVKDILLYKQRGETALKRQQQKQSNKQLRAEDFVLDGMGEDLRKRRRRSPNETLTAEEIAEYMGASNVPSGRDGGVMFKCKYCSEELEHLVGYLQHTLTVHNAYICHQCGKSFTTKSSLLRHRPIHTGLRRFACNICKKSFYRKDKCKSHIKRHLPASEQNIDQYQRIEPVPESAMTSGAARRSRNNTSPLDRQPPPPPLSRTDTASSPRAGHVTPASAAAAAVAAQLTHAATAGAPQLSQMMTPFSPGAALLANHSLPEICNPMIM